MEILYCTTFSEQLYKFSGQKMLETFHQFVEGPIFVATEGFSISGQENQFNYDLVNSEFLSTWLETYKDIIPEEYGGGWAGCLCKTSDRKKIKNRDKRLYKGHACRCPGYGFNYKASRWFRKIATLYEAVQLYEPEILIFVDADIIFKAKLPFRVIENKFFGNHRPSSGKKGKPAYCFYLKGRKRKAIESSFIGFKGERGREILQEVFDCYTSGEFQKHVRWDDGAIFGDLIKDGKDLAGDTRRTDPVEVSITRQYMTHLKGKHWREELKEKAAEQVRLNKEQARQGKK